MITFLIHVRDSLPCPALRNNQWSFNLLTRGTFLDWRMLTFRFLDGPEGNVLGAFIANVAEPTGNPAIPAVTIT
jgi:hypothetical protein